MVTEIRVRNEDGSCLQVDHRGILSDFHHGFALFWIIQDCFELVQMASVQGWIHYAALEVILKHSDAAASGTRSSPQNFRSSLICVDLV